MSRPIGWLIRRIGAPTLLILVLLGVALASLAWTLSAIVRGLDLELLATIILLGAVTGWLLARSPIRAGIALPLTFVLGVASVLIRVGQLGFNLFTLGVALTRVIWNAQFQRVDLQPLLAELATLSTAILTLLMRLETWALAIVRGRPDFDPVANALAWSTVLWIIATWTTWQLRRNARPFDALMPILLLLGFVLAYTGREAWVMFVLIAVWLGLMVIVPHLARERRWEKGDISAAGELGFDLAVVAVPAILIILTATIVVPAISPREIERWVQQWTQTESSTANSIPNSFGLAPAPIARATTVFDEQSSPGLPRSHLLGASPELLKKLALTIQTDDAGQESNARYWLSNTYDQYNGHGWFTSGFQLRDYHADDRATDAAMPGYRVLHQTVRAENSSGMLYAAGILGSVDHDFQIAWRAEDDMFGAQVNANVYRVESFIPTFDAMELRAASDAYPDAIRSRYLALPDNVPPRVLALARDLTATPPTPYDRAVAIETYLRTIPYTLDLTAPPANRDVVDYFLFDLRRGYCDYYATAMAVLARAAGLPARLAVGYAAGDYDSTTGKYIVTEADAHSWTQIYFPEDGWVDFEPTSGRAAMVRDMPNALPRAPQAGSSMPSNFTDAALNRALQSVWFFILSIPALFGASVLLWFIIDGWRLHRLSSELALGVLYRRMFHTARLLRLTVTPSHTPYQVAAMLDSYFAKARYAQHSASAWQRVRETIRRFAEMYVRAMYGARVPDEKEKAQMIRRWQSISGYVWFAILFHRLRSVASRWRWKNHSP